MLLNEPQPSPYDLHFSLFGIRVRVSWTFWLVAVIFGYDNARLIDALFAKTSPSIAPWLIVWCAIMFASIVLHEMGHALAFRWYGYPSSITLYHFGGFARPEATFGRGLAMRLSPWQNIVISAAGPGTQLALAAIIVAVVRYYDYLPIGLPPFIANWSLLDQGKFIQEAGICAAVMFALHINVYWALFNLIPVLPLDGGRIASEVIALCGGSMTDALKLSLIVAIIVALWFLKEEQVFAAMFFASMAGSNYQLLSGSGGWRM